MKRIPKPKNPLRWFSERQKETHVSGYVHNGSGSIGSHTEVVSLKIVVAYDGPVDIGSRNITGKSVPNYWNNGSIENEAREATGIGQRVSCGVCCCGMIACMTIVCLPCYCHWRTNTYETGRTKVLTAKIYEISAQRLAQDIIELYKEADPKVTERVAAAQAAHQPVVVVANSPIQMAAGSGNITLSMEQLQLLLKQSASPQMAGVPSAPSAQPMLTQFSTQSMQPYPQPATQPPSAIPMAPMSVSASRS